jgi:hypothetical protein
VFSLCFHFFHLEYGQITILILMLGFTHVRHTFTFNYLCAFGNLSILASADKHKVCRKYPSNERENIS